MKVSKTAVWLFDELLDQIPGYWDGRWHRYGQWGCALGLGRYWAAEAPRSAPGDTRGRRWRRAPGDPGRGGSRGCEPECSSDRDDGDDPGLQ